MKEKANIKNLSIGWVVKVSIDSYLSPGYDSIRKILYCDYGSLGVDFLYHDQDFPIFYPIVDFKDSTQVPNLKNNQYVILPYSNITCYLESFGIKSVTKISKYRIHQISNLILKPGVVVRNPFFNYKKASRKELQDEMERLRKYKLDCSEVLPTIGELHYWHDLAHQEYNHKSSDSGYQLRK